MTFSNIASYQHPTWITFYNATCNARYVHRQAQGGEDVFLKRLGLVSWHGHLGLVVQRLVHIPATYIEISRPIAEF